LWYGPRTSCPNVADVWLITAGGSCNINMCCVWINFFVAVSRLPFRPRESPLNMVIEKKRGPGPWFSSVDTNDKRRPSRRWYRGNLRAFFQVTESL
jgi:hypothetical protein